MEETKQETKENSRELKVVEPEVQLAQRIAASGVVENTTAQKVYGTMQYLKGLGIDPMVGIHKTYMVNGRLGVYGDVYKGLVFSKAKECSIEEIKYWYENESGEKLDTWKPNEVYRACVFIRRAFPKCEYMAQFTVDEAKRAGLWGKGKAWPSYPEVMLMNRAFGVAAKLVCPDAVNGIEGEGITEYTEPEVKQNDMEATLRNEAKG